MTKLFISYARADHDIVLNISRQLQEAGDTIWIDTRRIRAGTLWSSETVERIEGCDIFLLFISSKSIDSDNVRRETDLASGAKRKIIALRIENIPLPTRWIYELAEAPFIEYQVSDWKSRLWVMLGHPAFVDKERKVLSTNTGRLLKVFLCHSSSDKQIVRELYRQLSSENWIDPWLDEEKLLPGENWDLEIKKAVKTADNIIVCLSRKSVNKEGYVQKEINHALDVADEKPEGTIFIIPLKLEPCDVPIRLGAWQWVNYYEEGAYKKLLLSLRKRAQTLDINSR